MHIRMVTRTIKYTRIIAVVSFKQSGCYPALSSDGFISAFCDVQLLTFPKDGEL